ILPGPHFAEISSQFHKPGIFFRFLALFPGEDLVDFGEHELSSPAIELGKHGRTFSNEARQANQAVLLLAAGSAPSRPTPGVRDKARYRDSCYTGSAGNGCRCAAG